MDLLGGIGTAVARRAESIRNAAPVPYVSSGALSGTGGYFQLGGRTNRTSQLEAYGSVGTLFGVVSAIAEAAAKQPWWVERVKRNGTRRYGPDDPQRTQLLAHPAAALWEKPNDFYSRHDLVETLVQHFKLTGEAYIVIVSDPRFPSVPLELWPVRPDRMEPVPSSAKFLAGYVYTGPSGEKVPLETSQVIQIKTPNPADPYRGLGPVQALLMDLDSIRYSAAWNRKFFANDASPGGIIEVEDNMSDVEFQKLRDRWYDQHTGIGNAHRVAFLTKMKWVPNAFSPKDIQFAELRRVSSDAIREAFRVHKAILGQSDDVNRANAVAADFQLANWNVDPALSRLAGALNTRLLPLYGDPVTVEMCYESAVEDDQERDDAHVQAQAQVYATLVGAGVDPLDAAAVAGLPPMRTTTAPAETPAPTEQEGAAA